MDDDGFDPLAEGPRSLGAGLLEGEMGTSSALAHLYRAEVHRMTRWCERLDRTTNWAVTVMAPILTWAFSDPGIPHHVVLLGAVTVRMFLGIEARRFRGHIVWRTRSGCFRRTPGQGLDASV